MGILYILQSYIFNLFVNFHQVSIMWATVLHNI